MAGFLTGLFETKASASPKGAIARATGSSQGVAFGSIGGLGQVGTWDIDQAVRNGLERVIWIFRCVDAIAQNQAGIPILLRRGLNRQGGQIIDDPRLWKLLNFRANTYERAWQFRYRLSAQLLLARRGAFVEVINGQDGRPSELHLLPAGMTRPIPDKDKFVSKYEVTRSDYQIDELTPDRVIWLRLKPHPTDPYMQMTPLMAAGIDADTDYLARLFNRNFLANDGRPGMLVTIDGGIAGLNPDDAKEIKARFSGGPYNAGRTTVIEASNVNVADLSATPRDVQWGELLSTAKERLLLAFGVPESVMGNASGRTFDNADAERENFWLDTMVNHCDNLAASLDPLSGDIEDDTVFGFDYSTVDVLQRALARKRQEWRDEVAAGLRTVDEYFKETGRPQWSVAGTQALMMPNNLLIGPTPEIQAQLDKMVPIGAAAMPAGGNIAATARAGATQGAAAGMRQLNNIVAARAMQLGGSLKRRSKVETKEVAVREDIVDAEFEVVTNDTPKEKTHPYLSSRYHLEGMIEGVVLGWDNRQSTIIPERLGHVKSRKGTRHWDGAEPGTKALDAHYAVEIERWADDLKASIQAVVERAVGKELRAAAKDLDANGLLDVMIDRGMAADSSAGAPVDIILGNSKQNVIDNIVKDAMAVVDTAARNQSSRVAKKIEELDQSGASLQQIERAIKQQIGVRSSWRKQLATNLTTTAIEGAKNTIYRSAGDLVLKSWATMSDERVRATHERVDGTEKKMDQTFRVGAARMDYPGQATGHPEEEINCRCWLEYHVNHEALTH